MSLPPFFKRDQDWNRVRPITYRVLGPSQSYGINDRKLVILVLLTILGEQDVTSASSSSGSTVVDQSDTQDSSMFGY